MNLNIKLKNLSISRFDKIRIYYGGLFNIELFFHDSNRNYSSI